MKKGVISFTLALVMVFALFGQAFAVNNSGALSEAHTLSGDYFVKTDGTLWKLSDENTGLPVQVATGIRSVYAGVRYQVVVKTDGSLWSDWGRNFGDPDVPWNAEDPYQVKMPVDDAVYVSCGSSNMGVVTKDGVLWMWGEVPNPFADADAYVPYAGSTIDTMYSSSFKDPYGNGAIKVMDNVRTFCAGSTIAAAIRTDGSLWTWGDSDYGALGNGGGYDFEWASSHYLLEPAKILDDVTEVSLGWSFGAAITTDSSLYVWGDNSRGQQGNGESGYEYSVNRPVKIMDNVVRVSCYEQNAAAITADGSLYVWGESYRGSVGNGSTSLVTTPVKIMDDVVDVSFIPGGASRGTLALKRDGTLWAWGVASLLGQGADFVGNDECQVKGLLYSEGERLQTTPIQVAKDVALPDIPDTRPMVAGFNDVRVGDYYAASVQWAMDTGVTYGTTTTTFSPDATVTRGQAVTFLWRAIGKPEPEAVENPFADVQESDYFYKPVLWAVEQSITNGTGIAEFSPGSSVTRSQIITFLYRTLGEPGKTGFGTWYEDAENWAVRNSLLDGTAVSYSPDAECPRADVVFYLWKTLG